MFHLLFLINCFLLLFTPGHCVNTTEKTASLDTIGELESKWQCYIWQLHKQKHYIISQRAMASSANFSPQPSSFSARVSRVEVTTVLTRVLVCALPKYWSSKQPPYSLKSLWFILQKASRHLLWQCLGTHWGWRMEDALKPQATLTQIASLQFPSNCSFCVRWDTLSVNWQLMLSLNLLNGMHIKLFNPLFLKYLFSSIISLISQVNRLCERKSYIQITAIPTTGNRNGTRTVSASCGSESNKLFSKHCTDLTT